MVRINAVGTGHEEADLDSVVRLYLHFGLDPSVEEEG